jgi:hypothetical protein
MKIEDVYPGLNALLPIENHSPMIQKIFSHIKNRKNETVLSFPLPHFKIVHIFIIVKYLKKDIFKCSPSTTYRILKRWEAGLQYFYFYFTSFHEVVFGHRKSSRSALNR